MHELAIRLFEVLHGSWTGRGVGNYPTIDAFEYEERLRFEFDPTYPIVHFEQRTFLFPSGEHSHWESGFIRPVEGDRIDMSTAQDSGRVEVLHGRITDDSSAGWTLDLEHVVLGHDPRLIRTRRTLTINDDRLTYVVFMATHTTPEPVLQQHLRAELRRGSD